MLRNRTSRQTFDTTGPGQPLKKSSNFFAPPSFAKKIPNLLEQSQNKIPQLYPLVQKTLIEIDTCGISDQKKTELGNKFVKFCCAHSILLNELSQDTEALQHLAEAYAAAADPQPAKHQPPSFLFDLFKKLSLAALGNYSSLAALFASLSLPAAKALASGIKINGGTPEGGVDLCGAANMYCTQGYLSNETTGEVIAQFSRTLSSIFSRNQGNVITLLNCLSIDEVGNVTADFFEKGYANGTAICTANSIPVSGYTATVQATSLPDSACNSFQQTFNPLFTECVNEANSVQTIVGAAVGGAVGAIAVAAAIAIFSYKTECCRKKPSF